MTSSMASSHKFGDIIVAPFRFTDQTKIKIRPCVVVSSAEYNDKMPDLLVAAITSNLSLKEGFGSITIQQWREAGLPKESVIKPLITSVHNEIVKSTLGTLHTGDLELLRNMLEAVIGK